MLYDSVLFKLGVFLDEAEAHMLRNTIEKLLDDCERRQALVQELITSSNKLQYVYTFNTFLLVGIDAFYVHFVITAARKSSTVKHDI